MAGTRRRPSRLILVLGGAASGKSEAALDLAGDREPKAFVATGQALDNEMYERIARHRATRPSAWSTAEVPIELAAWFMKQGKTYRTIVLDCMTLWLSNLRGQSVSDSAIEAKLKHVLVALRATSATVVAVSNELGLGLVPSSRSARAFRDVAGRVNQQIAAEADEVYFVVSGMPLRLK